MPLISPSEEQKPLEDFFEAKQLKVRNEMLDDGNTLIAQALKDEDMASSDDDAAVAAGADRGSADEDEESVDEDFTGGSESDVAEEYDSAHESSGSDASDADMADGSGGEEEARPKKKAKTK